MEYMPKMDTKTAHRLIAAAVAVDAVQVVASLTGAGVILSPVVSLIATLGFARELKQYGIPLTQAGYLKRYIAVSLFELVPFLDDFPVWTFTIVSILRAEKVI
jgi:hypothetical protein